MTLDRRRFGLLLASAGLGPLLPPLAGPAFASTRSILEAELASGRACGLRDAALRGTLARLAGAKPPKTGRAIVVDIPSQHLAAYEDGDVALESRVVVGDPSWRTPDLDTSVTFVRFNPTWTVPESILKARSWRSRLASDPAYFERMRMSVEVGGRMLEPYEASGLAARAGRFVQRPGPGNALGRVKLGLAAGNAVYLHDTSDPGGFGEDARTLSHGCVRVERAMDLAAWALGMTPDRADGLLNGDDRTDRRPPAPVRVVTTYFTAWPDDYGRVRYYDDVYGLDPAPVRRCGDPVEDGDGPRYRPIVPRS